MTQRNERCETQGVKPALIFSIFLDAALERLEVREEISVRQNNAPWLGRGSGGVKNLSNRVSRRSFAGINCGTCFRLRHRRNIFETVDHQRRRATGRRSELAVAQDQLYTCILDGPLNEIGRCCRVDRNNDCAAQKKAPEARNPLGGVRAPQKGAISGPNSAGGERVTPKHGVSGQIRIRQLFAAVPACLDDGDITGEAGKIIEESEQISSGHKRLSFFALARR